MPLFTKAIGAISFWCFLFLGVLGSSAVAQQDQASGRGALVVSSTGDVSSTIAIAAFVFFLLVLALIIYLILQFRDLRNTQEHAQNTRTFTKVRRIIVVLFVGITLFISTLGYYALTLSKATFISDVSDKLLHSVTASNQRLDTWLHRQKAFLQRVGTDPVLVTKLTSLNVLSRHNPKSAATAAAIKDIRDHFSAIEADVVDTGTSIVDILTLVAQRGLDCPRSGRWRGDLL